MRLFGFLLAICSVFTGSATKYPAPRGDHPTPVYVALKQRNTDRLQALLLDRSDPASANYGVWMSPQEIRGLVEPLEDDQGRVIQWLEGYPLQELHNYGDALRFTTNRSVVCEIFGMNCTLKLVGYRVPGELSDLVEFVEMSRHEPKGGPWDTVLKVNQQSRDNHTDDRYFGREPMMAMYNITDVKATQASAGAAEYQNNGGFTNADLDQQQGLNAQVVHNITHIQGENEGTDIESELDVQMISQAADGAQVWFWNNPYWLYSWAVDFQNTTEVPDVVSMSWGWAEDSQCDIIDCSVNLTSQKYVERVNVEYVKIGLRGVTLVASSGDAGAPGRTNELCEADRPINPVFPSSSPYVLSVGATYVAKSNVTRNYSTPLCQASGCVTGHEERSIQYGAVDWTAGGGFDLYQNATPAWQAAAVQGYLASGVTLPQKGTYHPNGRAYPDVAAVGHSCPTVVDGELMGIDGTSCSSPVVAGLVALMNQHRVARNRSRVGFVNPLLYGIQAKCPECFRDVVQGYNWCTEDRCCENTTDYGFQAVRGWDPVAGLGSLNVGRILEYL